jgi:large subunit ribosomal protein L23
MNQEKVLRVLLGPIVSEKTTLATANNQYVFKVRTDSNKREIRAAVEELFGVTVEGVTTSNVKGKKKIYKGKTGQRVNWKKAVVKVSEGQMIDATAS